MTMGGDVSAYAALGLEPGADRASVERAYRALIKHYHPDRAGGDAARAAEITRAYRELCEARSASEGIIFHDDADRGGGARFGGAWLAVLLALLLAALVLVFMVARDTPFVANGLAKTAERLSPALGKSRSEPMREPIATGAVDAGVRDALGIARRGDEMALANASRACHDQLRVAPTVALLDRCAAFDDAVVQLQDRDPLRDRGRFSELAVTGRQWSAAKELSDDFVAIDGRLDQIRLRVELAVAGSAQAGAN